MIEIKQINDLMIYHHQINKFKTNSITLVFENLSKVVDFWPRKLLNRILRHSCHKYPQEELVIRKNIELYNLDFSIADLNLGKVNLTVIEVQFLAADYVSDPNYLSTILEYIMEFINNPLLIDGQFSHQVFDEVKRSHQENVLMLRSKKNKMASIKFFEAFLGNLDYISYQNVDIDALNKVTLDDVMKSYQLLLNSSAYLVVIGNPDLDLITNHFQKYPQLKTNPTPYQYYQKNDLVIQNNHIIEENDTNQSLLLLGYKTSIYRTDPQFWTFRLFSAMFGEFFNSSLIQEIREKSGLAYTIGSQFLSRHQAFTITAGILANKQEVVLSLISRIINNYQQGMINPILLEQSKKTLISKIKSDYDYLFDYFVDCLDQRGLSTPDFVNGEQLFEKINQITIDDIAKVAQTLKLDTIYFMKGN